MTSPEISVIMPVYNGKKYLAEAIDSVLNQTFQDFEFIIINDGSTDKSMEIIKSFKDDRIVIINQDNQGVAKSLNNGINIARGKYIARMDADDISYKDRFKIQVDYLEKNLNVIAIGSNADVIDKDGVYVYTTDLPLDSSSLKNKLPHNSPFIHPSVMTRKDILVEIGGYTDMPLGQDLLLFNKMSIYGEYVNIKEPLINYRISPQATTRRSNETKKNIRKVINHYLLAGKISDTDRYLLLGSQKKTSKDEKYYQYHLLLTKKYLWNNYQPFLARIHLKKSLRYNTLSFFVLVMFIMSYLPEKLVIAIYSLFKQICEK